MTIPKFRWVSKIIILFTLCCMNVRLDTYKQQIQGHVQYKTISINPPGEGSLRLSMSKHLQIIAHRIFSSCSFIWENMDIHAHWPGSDGKKNCSVGLKLTLAYEWLVQRLGPLTFLVERWRMGHLAPTHDDSKPNPPIRSTLSSNWAEPDDMEGHKHVHVSHCNFPPPTATDYDNHWNNILRNCNHTD